MSQEMYAVKDLKADSFTNPIFAVNQAVMFRQCQEIVNDPQGNQYTKFPNDFQLYHLGAYNESTAEFELLPEPLPLCPMSDFLNQNANDEGVIQ